jgi:hypothetical protein
MRLLKRKVNSNFSLTEFIGDSIPRYAIFSHTWGADDEEVTYKDLTEGTYRMKLGYRKNRFCVHQAIKDNLYCFWVDNCCMRNVAQKTMPCESGGRSRRKRWALKMQSNVVNQGTAHPKPYQKRAKSNFKFSTTRLSDTSKFVT